MPRDGYNLYDEDGCNESFLQSTATLYCQKLLPPASPFVRPYYKRKKTGGTVLTLALYNLLPYFAQFAKPIC